MVNVTQDVVFLMESPRYPYDISTQGVNMALNRFCIDEEMAYEVSGVFLKNPNVFLPEWKENNHCQKYERAVILKRFPWCYSKEIDFIGIYFTTRIWVSE